MPIQTKPDHVRERISNNIWCKFAVTLLDLVREMEQLLNDYRRLLTA